MIGNATAKSMIEALHMEIKSQYPNLEYSEQMSHIIRALVEYFGNKELVIVHVDDLGPGSLAINPYSSQFYTHIESALGVDELACENERRKILTLF